MDSILAETKGPNGRYLVFWASYPVEKATWEPKRNIRDPEILQTWKETKANIARGEKPAFDLVAHNAKLKAIEKAKKHRRRLRKLKRKRRGMPVSPDTSDCDPTEAVGSEDNAENADGIRRKKRLKATTEKPNEHTNQRYSARSLQPASKPLTDQVKISGSSNKRTITDSDSTTLTTDIYVGNTKKAGGKVLRDIKDKCSARTSTTLEDRTPVSTFRPSQMPALKTRDRPDSRSSPDIPIPKQHLQSRLSSTTSISSCSASPAPPPARESSTRNSSTSIESLPIIRGQVAKRSGLNTFQNVFIGGRTGRSKASLIEQAADPTKARKHFPNMHIQHKAQIQSRNKADAAPDPIAVGGLFDPSNPTKLPSMKPSTLQRNSSSGTPRIPDDLTPTSDRQQGISPLSIPSLSPEPQNHDLKFNSSTDNDDQRPLWTPGDGLKSICHYWFTKNYCSRGDTCFYFHTDDINLPVAPDPKQSAAERKSIPKSRASIGSSSQENSLVGKRAPLTTKPLKDTICFFWDRRGSCDNGDNCPYSHIKHPRISTAPLRRNLKACRYFLNSTCFRGDRCAYIHPQDLGTGSASRLKSHDDSTTTAAATNASDELDRSSLLVAVQARSLLEERKSLQLPETFDTTFLAVEESMLASSEPPTCQPQGVLLMGAHVPSLSEPQNATLSLPRKSVPLATGGLMENAPSTPLDTFSGSQSQHLNHKVDSSKVNLVGTSNIANSTIPSAVTPNAALDAQPEMTLKEDQRKNELGKLGPGAKEVIFGSEKSPSVVLNFVDIEQALQQPWGQSFLMRPYIEFDQICTAQDFMMQYNSVLSQVFWQGSISIKPNDSSILATLINVSQQLRISSGGLLSSCTDFLILVYPPAEEWSFMDSEAAQCSSDVPLRYLIYQTSLEIGRALASPVGERPSEYRRKLVKNIHELSFTKLLPKQIKNKTYHFYLLFPPSASGTARFLSSWLSDVYSHRLCKIYSSQTEGSWDSFVSKKEIEFGTVLIHESVLATIAELPSLQKVIAGPPYRSNNFWYINDSCSPYPCFSPPPGSRLGQITATRLLPHGQAILLTPSFIIAEPERAVQIIRWFRDKLKASVADTYKLVCCFKVSDYLLDLALDKSSERDDFHEKHRDNPSKDALAEQAGLSWRASEARFSCHKYISELLSIDGTDEYPCLYNLDLLDESSPVVYADEIIDPEDEPALVTWFAGWAMTKLDRFRKFTVFGTGDAGKECAVRVRKITIATPASLGRSPGIVGQAHNEDINGRRQVVRKDGTEQNARHGCRGGFLGRSSFPSQSTNHSRSGARVMPATQALPVETNKVMNLDLQNATIDEMEDERVDEDQQMEKREIAEKIRLEPTTMWYGRWKSEGKGLGEHIFVDGWDRCSKHVGYPRV